MFTREEFKALEFEQKKEVMEWRAKFHAKKSKATSEVKRIKKNGYNKFHQYHFATESDVKDEIGKILFDNGLSFDSDLVQRSESEPRKTNNGFAVTTTVQMIFTLTDTETGYFETFTQDGTAMDTGDKGIYKAYSSTIKYALMNQFLIPTGDDTEKDGHELQPEAPGTTQQQNGSKNQGQPPKRQEQGKTDELPAWRQIMNAEDELAKVSGRSKADVRIMLKEKFGEIGKYKELDERRAGTILDYLKGSVEYFTNPQG